MTNYQNDNEQTGVSRKPSQAEGERENDQNSHPMPKDYPSKPSQAEGEREEEQE